jgi:endonuclease/exonuclease/phosphatase family metal-dependent hydrolase
MRWIATSAALTLALSSTSATPARRASPDPGPAPLKVMTFNIQHGIDGSNKYNLQRAIEVIARVQPDLVALQEVTRNHPYYDCEDQPAKMAEGLRATTSKPWTVAYEQEWFTFNVECQQSGRGDGRETEGLAFLAPGPLGTTSMTPLPVSRIGFAVKWQAAGGLPVIATHLASGRNNVDARRREVEALLKWSATFGTPQLLVGDFNATPDDEELQPLLTMFRDAWRDAAGARSASGGEATHGTRQIDFVFYRGDGLRVLKVETLDTRSWFGKPASDHRPVVATLSRMLK